MKNTLVVAAALIVAAGFAGLLPRASAAAGDSINFNLRVSAGAAACLKSNAFGRVTVSDLGPAPKKAAAGPAAPAIRVVRGTDASRVSLGAAGVEGSAKAFRDSTAAGLGRAAAQAPAGGVTP